MIRRRLPNRRAASTHDLIVDGRRYEATIGFDPAGAPKEIFLTGAKGGSDVAAILGDVSVAISVALQSGVAAAAMAASVVRAGLPSAPISVVGAALVLLATAERKAGAE